MKLEGTCDWRALGFGDERLAACVTLSRGQLRLEGQAIVINADAEPARIHGWRHERLAPMSSVQLRDVTIDAPANLLVLAASAEPDHVGIPDNPSWTRFRNGDRPIDLWRSPREVIGEAQIDIERLRVPEARPREAGARRHRFEVAVNLWFAPAGTHCLIHREHAFIEIHSQIAGIGHMQKFRTQDPASLYEDIALAPGATTEQPFCVVDDTGVPSYPWHQYFAESDCIWLAIEYHPLMENNGHA